MLSRLGLQSRTAREKITITAKSAGILRTKSKGEKVEGLLSPLF